MYNSLFSFLLSSCSPSSPSTHYRLSRICAGNNFLYGRALSHMVRRSTRVWNTRCTPVCRALVHDFTCVTWVSDRELLFLHE
jgi:hypothetical protein